MLDPVKGSLLGSVFEANTQLVGGIGGGQGELGGDGGLHVGADHMLGGDTDDGLVVDLGAELKIRVDQVGRAQSKLGGLVFGVPADLSAKFDILVDTVVDGTAELLAIVGEGVEGVVAAEVAKGNASVLQLVVGDIELSLNTGNPSVLANDGGGKGNWAGVEAQVHVDLKSSTLKTRTNILRVQTTKTFSQ